jgi:hypothetical protein
LRKCVLALFISFAVVTNPLADSKVVRATADDRCLASAIFYEARGEPIEGKRAVYDVLQHRMLDSGKSACAIIAERRQFSWYPRKPILPLTYGLHEMLIEVKQADKVLINENYKFFHSGKKPSWARKMLCRKIFNHSFCKEKK